MNIEVERQTHQFIIWVNPRGVFLTIHSDSQEGHDGEENVTVDSMKFDSLDSLMNWLDTHAMPTKNKD